MHYTLLFYSLASASWHDLILANALHPPVLLSCFRLATQCDLSKYTTPSCPPYSIASLKDNLFMTFKLSYGGWKPLVLFIWPNLSYIQLSPISRIDVAISLVLLIQLQWSLSVRFEILRQWQIQVIQPSNSNIVDLAYPRGRSSILLRRYEVYRRISSRDAMWHGVIQSARCICIIHTLPGKQPWYGAARFEQD